MTVKKKTHYLKIGLTFDKPVTQEQALAAAKARITGFLPDLPPAFKVKSLSKLNSYDLLGVRGPNGRFPRVVCDASNIITAGIRAKIGDWEVNQLIFLNKKFGEGVPIEKIAEGLPYTVKQVTKKLRDLGLLLP